jgi:hypothetical protein
VKWSLHYKVAALLAAASVKCVLKVDSLSPVTWGLQVAGSSWLIISSVKLTFRRAAISSACID